MFQENFKRPHMSLNIEQHGDDYIRPNVDLEMRPKVKSKEQVKCMYSWVQLKLDFWEHENLSSLSVLIYIKLYCTRKRKKSGLSRNLS